MAHCEKWEKNKTFDFWKLYLINCVRNNKSKEWKGKKGGREAGREAKTLQESSSLTERRTHYHELHRAGI